MKDVPVKYILVTIVIVLLLLAIYFGYKELHKAISPAPGNKISAGNKTAPASSSGFPLKQGSSGQSVTNLQNYLNYSGSYGLTVDGQFGPATLAAVQTELTIPGQPSVNEVSAEYYNEFVLPYMNGQTGSTDNNGAGVVTEYDTYESIIQQLEGAGV